jgi:hypothetical protein
VLVVLVDTNIWVSAFINPHGYPAKLKDAWLNNQFQVVVSVPLLDEIAEVLDCPRIRNKYRVQADEVHAFLQLLSMRAIHVIPTGQLHICRDPDDDLILETALLGQASYAVSRDDDIKRDQDLMAQMQAQGVAVVSVKQFLELLNLSNM